MADDGGADAVHLVLLPIVHQHAVVGQLVGCLPDRDLLDHSNARLIAALRVSPEGQEGLSAFLDKRTPAWSAGA